MTSPFCPYLNLLGSLTYKLGDMPMKQPNRVKAGIRENRVALGYDLHFPSTHIIEILGPLDFDFVWIDGEHGPFGLGQIEEIWVIR